MDQTTCTRRQWLSIGSAICGAVAVAGFNRAVDYASILAPSDQPDSLQSAYLSVQEREVVQGIIIKGRAPHDHLHINRPHVLKGLIDAEVLVPRRVKHLLFASSIGYLIDSATVEEEFGTFVNLSIAGGKPNDYLTWAHIMQSYDVRPERVVMAISPWTVFDGSGIHQDLHSFAPRALFELGAIDRNDADLLRKSAPMAATNEWETRSPGFFTHWSPQYTQFNVANLLTDLRGSSSLTWSVAHQDELLNGDLSVELVGKYEFVTPNDVVRNAKDEWGAEIASPYAYLTATQDSDAIHRLRLAIEFYRRQGTTVELLFAPVSMAWYESLRSQCVRDGKEFKLDETIAFLNEFARREGLLVRGRNISPGTLTNDGFIDRIHQSYLAAAENFRFIN